MATRFEGSFKGHDQIDLFFQLWSAENARGTMVLTHGLAEHSECYHPLAKVLQNDGWEVYGWDLRGHGRSEGKRGYAKDFQDYVSDLKVFVQFVAKERKKSDVPLLLFGHSLGGLITLMAALQNKDLPIRALCLSSPLLGIAVEVPKIKDQIARLTVKWMPGLTLHNEIKYEDLTRDEAMIKSYDQDALRHDKISPAVYLGMIDGSAAVAAQAKEIDLPVLMLLSGDDRIVSTPAAKRVFELLPNKRNLMHVYPESRHEIFNDLDRDQALSDLKKFINQFTGGNP